jgi:hypothetical protein
MRLTLAAQRARGIDKPSAQRGRGECRVPSAPAASCAKWVVQDAHEYSQRSHRKSPGIPARNGFNGFLRDLPGDRLFCHRRLQIKSANLTPASRRQDHTTSPSARKALSSEAPLASTASRPASVTMASAPRVGRDSGDMKVIWAFGKPEYFLQWDWTDRNSLIGFKKFVSSCKSVEA